MHSDSAGHKIGCGPRWMLSTAARPTGPLRKSRCRFPGSCSNLPRGEGLMKRSTERFLTTHTGSLPRPDDLIRVMFAREEGVPVDGAALAARVRSAVDDVVRMQVECGLDVVNDGELSKPSYATYIKDRLHGFGGESHALVYQDLAEFPELAQRVFGDPGRSRRRTPACTGPISVRDPRAAQTDAEVVTTAVARAKAGEGFLSAA